MIVCYIAQSIDGYIATKDGGIDWLPTPSKDGEDYGYSQFLQSVQGIVMGRKTYETCLSFGKWPHSQLPTRVFSHKLPTDVDSTQPNVSFVTQTPKDVCAEWTAQGIQRIWLVGGSELIASFRKARLVDEYIITSIPVILGEGIPLFQPMQHREFFCCTASKHFDSGLEQSTFRRI